MLALAILIGGGLTLWARLRLNAVLAVSPTAEIGVVLAGAVGDCGTPALYIVPVAGSSGTDYRVLLDVLGGPNRFPDLGGATATAVLALPESRRPGVGLGRGLVGSCQRMTLELSGGFAGAVMEPLPETVTLEATGPGALRLSYARASPAELEDALASFTLQGVPDGWQFGHKRVRFANGGPLGRQRLPLRGGGLSVPEREFQTWCIPRTCGGATSTSISK